MDVLKSILRFAAKAFASLILIGIVFGFSIYGYQSYKVHQELSWLTPDKCEEYSEAVQLCAASTDTAPYLRHIDREEAVVIVFDLTPYGSRGYYYNYTVFWITDCEIGSAIETGRFFSNEEPILAECVEASETKMMSGFSTALRVGIQFDSASTENNISFNFGGFSSEFDFNSVDYSPLQQAITLQRARPLSEIIAEREAAAARAEEARLAAAARAEEARLAAAARAEEERQRIAQERLELEARQRDRRERIRQCEAEEDVRYTSHNETIGLAKRYISGGQNIELIGLAYTDIIQNFVEATFVLTNTSIFTITQANFNFSAILGSQCPNVVTDNSAYFRGLLAPDQSAEVTAVFSSYDLINRDLTSVFCTSMVSITFAEENFARRECN